LGRQLTDTMVEHRSQAMQVDITFDDTDAFNAPWSVMQRYDRIQRQMDEQICAENNLQFFQIPVASNPDF
jgi:hypothetical protein